MQDRTRQEVRQQSLDALRQAATGDGQPTRGASSNRGQPRSLEYHPCTRAGSEPPVEPISLEEELLLLKYYGTKLQLMCRELRFPK